jgi:multiple antibiotic resistance protein
MGGPALKEVLTQIALMVSALFPIVNPLGSAPIFLTLTGSASRSQRTTLSGLVARNSFFLLLGSILIGSHVLSFFGISLPIVQVGGGLVVISAGWAMLKSEDENDRQQIQRSAEANLMLRKTFYPLTLPLTVGPGSISVAVTLGANAPHPGGEGLVLALLAAVASSLVVSVSVFLCYTFAGRVVKLLGPSGASVIMRLSAFLLMCIGLQIVWNGVSSLVRTL